MSLPRPQGLMGEWVELYSKRIMAPDEFHMASAIAALSTAVGKGVTFSLGGLRFPSMWTLILAPAGSGKSVAFAPLKWAVNQMDASLMLPSRGSPEAFIEATAERPAGLWIIGEMGGLIGNLSRGYAQGFDTDLCDLWDHNTVVHRKVKTGKDVNERRVNEPSITAVATGRATDFIDQAGIEMFTSGLLSRFLVFSTDELPAYRGLRVQQHSSPPEEQDLIERLHRIKRSVSRTKKATMSEGFIDRWEADDEMWVKQTKAVPRHLEGFAKRRGIQALKLATLHAISRTGVPELEDVDAAWGCLVASECYENVVSLLGTTDIGLNEKDRARSGILDRARSIAAADSTICTIRDLYRSVARQVANTRDLEGMVGVWVEAGIVERGMLGKAKAIRFLNLDRPAPEGWAVSE